MSLETVETANSEIPITGGCAWAIHREGDPPLPELHAGDESSIFAEGRQPLVYNDAGAFDRRDFSHDRVFIYSGRCAAASRRRVRRSERCGCE
jgi:hypothetical protein